MKKGGFLRNVLDTIRSNQAIGPSGKDHGSSNERSIEFGGQLKPSHFTLCHVARHGFPENPTALAFDPVQKIAAIGTKSGAIRIFGRPGVDVSAQHEPASAVTHMRFIINQGAIITATADESIHLWSLRGPNLRLLFSSGAQGAAGSSPQASSPVPTPASNISSVSPQSGNSMVIPGVSGITSTATSSSSFLGQITDTVSGAVDSASDFLSGSVGDHQTTPSPTSDTRHSVSRKPELLHTLKFQREHITYIHQTLTSKWLYIGTERGNVHVANVETFELSGYQIAWNKAIELSRKTHPGSIIHISECPQDTNKLLIGYESGCIVIWDLKQRSAEGRYYYTENLLWLAWHYEGKQFVAAHGDGSLITWQIRSNTRPSQILHPHAKTTSSAGGSEHMNAQHQQQQALSSSFARSLNNELYRPINKVEWKISKSTNEPFYLFSGGLPYDGFDEVSSGADAPDLNRPTTALVGQQRQPTSASPSQLLKASSVSPSCLPVTASPVSLNRYQDLSPGSKVSGSADLRQLKTPQQYKEKRSLRSTSLTVMYGKSITVLEMDDTIIDFITICDSSPYENDTSDPYAVIVLLSNELILIDLTSSGYPSFDCPYPSASLNESPVTCVHYLADCSSDLIPFLYSTSQNVISRAPKKGFSDKEWPINGGEWGQSLQSYPELVITGHADGTIKFWDMSGINFDLISKIKTSKLFEKPNKPSNAIFLPVNNALVKKRSTSPTRISSSDTDHVSSDQHELNNRLNDEDLFAIEKIEFCSSTKRLLVAGACAQVIQFRLNKRDSHSTNPTNFTDLTTMMIEPNLPSSYLDKSQSGISSSQNQWKKHCLFQVKPPHGGGASSSSGGSSSSSSSHRSRGLSGFQAELVCITPLLISSNPPNDENQPLPACSIACLVPPRITAISFQATHNILAYAHEFGIVLIDIIQKCVIMNATLNDLAGGSLINTGNRDISIQPYATSSILQHHYQTTSMGSTSAFATGKDFTNRPGATSQTSDVGTAVGHHIKTESADSGRIGSSALTDTSSARNGAAVDVGQVLSPSRATPPASKPSAQSRYTNSMFQRQLSTNALNINAQPPSSTFGPTATTNKQGPRLFQRQMTASQLFSSASSSSTSGPSDSSGNSNMKRLLASRADANLAGSAACLTTAQNQSIAAAAAATGNRGKPSDGPIDNPGAKKAVKNKRIISRMLSISAIHTTVGSGGSSSQGGAAGGGLAKSPAEATGSLVHSANNSGVNSGLWSEDTNQPNEGTGSIDKFDSSFRRSRSSSTSSTTGHFQQLQQHQNEPGAHHNQQQLASESILCIALLDLAQSGPHSAGSGQASGSGGAFATNMTNSSFQAGQTTSASSSNSLASAATGSAATAAAAATAAGQVQSSAGPNHKSLSSIDNQQSGQLALWLGTSSGNVLLVCLQMPDNEDNRILQLQSISAEPIPHASIKLGGQILCIAPFTCEARLQPLGVSGAGGPSGSAGNGGGSSSQMSSSSGIQSASQSSSLEGDTHLQSPSSSGSSNSTSGGGGSCQVGGAGAAAMGAVGPSGGASRSGGPLDSPASASFDSRSSLFIAFVGEKEARVYQVPSGSLANASGAKSSSGGGAAGGGGASEHHHGSHHHGSHSAASGAAAAGAHQGQLQDSPIGALLTNKKNLVAKCELSDTSFACRSAVVHMRSPDESCLVSYLASGNIVVHALPRLRPILMDADFVPYSSSRLSSSMCLSRQGHCLYQPSAGEICKFTVASQYKAMVNEMMGLVYVPREMPEMPRTNFFKSLFSVSQSTRQSDRDELFGECSAGKPSRGVAKHIGSGGPAQAGGGGAGGSNSTGSGGLDKLKGAAIGSMGHEMRMAREGLDERGEKLSEIEDRTLNMMIQSESYAHSAHQLAQKFKDKKWYQF